MKNGKNSPLLWHSDVNSSFPLIGEILIHGFGWHRNAFLRRLWILRCHRKSRICFRRWLRLLDDASSPEEMREKSFFVISKYKWGTYLHRPHHSRRPLPSTRLRGKKRYFSQHADFTRQNAKARCRDQEKLLAMAKPFIVTTALFVWHKCWWSSSSLPHPLANVTTSVETITNSITKRGGK